MGNPRGVARDFDELERRRLAAVKMFEKAELNNSQIGRRLQVSNQTVSRWRKQYQAGGKQALRKAGRAGRKPKLEAGQLDRLVDLLKQGPERQGYETPLWTSDRVGRLVQREFGVDYHAGHVWKILRQLNWSPQRPVGRAIERNETAIEDWKKVRWPALKKKPRKRAGKSSSSMKAG
jgi:transposase